MPSHILRVLCDLTVDFSIELQDFSFIIAKPFWIEEVGLSENVVHLLVN